MRTVTATEKYRAVLEGKMAKREFVRQMRQQYPSMVSQYDGFDSTVQDLQHLARLLHRLLRGGVYGVPLLPEKFRGSQKQTRPHFPAHHIRPLVNQKRQVAVGLHPFGK